MEVSGGSDRKKGGKIVRISRLPPFQPRPTGVQRRRRLEMAPPFGTGVLEEPGALGKVMKTGQSRVPCRRERLSASFALP